MTSRRSDAATPAPEMSLPVVERLRRTVMAETSDIAEGRAVPYEAYSLRKSQALLELNRLLAALGPGPVSGPLGSALADLSGKLEINRRTLGVQLRASIAVAEIIARAIREGQSDGTYNSRAWRPVKE